ncbi:MAG: phosphate acyltransferase [Methylocystis sp.]
MGRSTSISPWMRNRHEPKGVISPVAGAADILIAPDIDAGNMMYKELSFMGKAQVAGVVMGAKVPVILTSR